MTFQISDLLGSWVSQREFDALNARADQYLEAQLAAEAKLRSARESLRISEGVVNSATKQLTEDAETIASAKRVMHAHREQAVRMSEALTTETLATVRAKADCEVFKAELLHCGKYDKSLKRIRKRTEADIAEMLAAPRHLHELSIIADSLREHDGPEMQQPAANDE